MEFWDAVASAGPYTKTICTSLQTDNHTNTSPLNFYRLKAIQDAQPTMSKHWRQKITSILKVWLRSMFISGCKRQNASAKIYCEKLGNRLTVSVRPQIWHLSVVYSPTGSWPKERRWTPHLHSSWGMAHFSLVLGLWSAVAVAYELPLADSTDH